MVEEHADLGHIALEQRMDEVELLRGREPVVRKMADVAPVGRIGVGLGQSGRDGHRHGRKQRQKPRARLPGGDVANAAGLQKALEHRSRGAPERRLRREPVDDGHVLEDLAHPLAVASRMPLAQHLCELRGVRGRVAGPNEAASDFGGRALHRFGVQRIAAEQVDLL